MLPEPGPIVHAHLSHIDSRGSLSVQLHRSRVDHLLHLMDIVGNHIMLETSSQQVHVRFVDIGKDTFVPVSDLYELEVSKDILKEFPHQAVSCGLAGFSPGHRTPKAVALLRKLAPLGLDMLLQAVVCNELANAGIQPVCSVTRPPIRPTTPFHRPPPTVRRYRDPAQWRTPDDKPICFTCSGVGHISRYCPYRQPSYFRSTYYTRRSPFSAPNDPTYREPMYRDQTHRGSTYSDPPMSTRPSSRSPSPQDRRSRLPLPRRPLPHLSTLTSGKLTNAAPGGDAALEP
ncbi:hypothetical protein HPB50_011906 [Hyalomma asiaticum]|uniref:Uncharacterized protein n=1 Tax=Hyalomma asiaticum TaxID=266040 RepID=A0ACB7TGE5_HYAAI|nr:hypothetical protein HPB50_011906 [Hyalomma asiaticum]